MPTKLDPGSDRVAACLKAVDELAKIHGSQNKAAIKTGLGQQKLNKFVNTKSLGIDFADQIAAVYETTVDGLVWLFVRGGEGAVRAGSVPGWQKAVEEAESRWPEYGQQYLPAADATLPLAPKIATPEFARDIARLLFDHARGSQTRFKAQRQAK
jgi:hypothetical protein